MDLTIYDVPDDEAVITEIKTNAQTIISNYILSQVPESKEMTDAKAQIEVIRAENITVTKPEEKI